MAWPTTLTIKAWTGESPVSGSVSAQARNWVIRTEQPNVPEYLKPPEAADAADWLDPFVSWGLVLPERVGLSPAELASGADAPERVRTLPRERNDAPVFRYRPGSPNRFTLLRNYAARKDISIDPRTPSGIADDALPQYLLIYGTPGEIPWDFQYVLNATCACGRLDLDGDALENYIQALLDDWQGASSQIDRALVWSVDLGPNDISLLMRNAIGAKVYEQWSKDATLSGKAVFYDGQGTGVTNQASVDVLMSALAERKPALVVTTSHGQTAPLGDLVTLWQQLGLPVDQNLQLLEPDRLLAAWEPDGAIWYAHACCSAGSDATTIFDGLLDAGSSIVQVLRGVAAIGALVAPLPRALLGAKKPLRAFIGHVEPTFDWTLKQPATGQHLTRSIVRALYNNIYTSKPVGLAFRDYYEPLGTLSTQYDRAFEEFKRGQDTRGVMLYCQLAARDLQSMVILGDPTAMLSPLP